MIVNQSELSSKLNKLKKIVPTRTTIPALQGVLVRDGYLIANNMEMAVKAKLEGAEGEEFVIPQKAFALIGSLPGGDVEIKKNDKSQIIINSGGTKTAFSTCDPDTFPFADPDGDDCKDVKIEADVLRKCFNNVLYAVSDTAEKQPMGCVYMKCRAGSLDFVGLDGHMIAWDRIPYEGEFALMIPKSSVSQLIGLDITGDVRIAYTDNSAVFWTREYVVETRLVAGQYFQYDRMFGESAMRYYVNRADIISTLTRATLCMDASDKRPVTMNFENDNCKINLQSAVSNFEENCPVSGNGTLEIGFNAQLLLKALKSFSDEDVRIGLSNPKSPMIVESEASVIKALILPVAIRSSSNQ